VCIVLVLFGSRIKSAIMECAGREKEREEYNTSHVVFIKRKERASSDALSRPRGT
jgi:hypothetical protein